MTFLTENPCRVALLVILSGTLLLMQPSVADAQTGKFTASGKVVAILAETKMLPGDKQGHEVTMVRRVDTVTYSDPIFGSGQATVVSIGDNVPGGGSSRGYFSIKHPSGDSTFTSYEGTSKATPKQGGPHDVTFEGKWQYIGGTGKFEGITGGGTYKGGVTAAGPSYEFDGQYTLKR